MTSQTKKPFVKKDGPGKWQKVGSLRKNDKGNLSIKIDASISLKEGQVLQLLDPRKNWEKLVALGKMTEDEMLEKQENLKWLRYELFIVNDDAPSSKI
jgi:hypothetical protein